MSSRLKTTAGKVSAKARVISQPSASTSAERQRESRWAKYEHMFSEEEIERFRSLKWLDPNSTDVIFEIYQTIQEIGWDNTWNFLSTVKTSSDVFWNNPLVSPVMNRAIMVEEALKNKAPKITKGIFRCPRDSCRSDQTASTQIQMRSGDEPPTTAVVCLVCNKRWTIGN
jgi:DNA-directed RNA polymerase subunit M/transcription elongation factor TFIIS